jgi:hypothetical protein
MDYKQDNRAVNLYATVKSTKKPLTLYKALQLGYLRNEDKQTRKLKKFGYIVDRNLTDNERLVAYNPTLKKTLFVSNGSETSLLKNPHQFGKDWSHNILNIGTGNIKNSTRYNQDKQTYESALKKYNTTMVLAGHSQAGSNLARIAHGNHQVYTLDPALINQKPRENVHNFRSRGDIISAGANDITTLSKGSLNPMKAHDIANIKNEPIFL